MRITNLDNYIRNKKKQQQRKFLPKEVIFILFLVLFFLSGIFYYRNEKYYQKLLLEKEKAKKNLKKLKASLQQKQSEMDMLLRKEGIENYARQNYNYLKPGEILVMPFDRKNDVEFTHKLKDK